MTEDFQEKYRDKTGELKPAVPLAADSAHLLTDYLDTVTVQLIKHGVVEAYRITREIEEILVLELQRQGSKTKLTYDVTSRVLEKFGSPIAVVKEYLNEHNPKRENILATSEYLDDNFDDNLDDDFEEDDGFDNSFFIKSKNPGSGYYENTKGFVILLLSYSVKFFVYAILAVNIFMFAGLSLMQLDYRYPVFDNDPDLMLPVFAFFILDSIASITGRSFIEESRYGKLTDLIRFEIFSLLILQLWAVFRMENGIFDQPFIKESYQFVVILTLSLEILKRNLNFLHSFSEKKPLVRFLLPSYLVLGLAYIFSYMALSHHTNIAHFDTDALIYFYISLILVIISLFMDINRKYPFSIKKFGYSLLFIPYIFMFFQYWIIQNNFFGHYYWRERIVIVLPTFILFVLLTTFAPYIDGIGNIFTSLKNKIRSSLNEYETR